MIVYYLDTVLFKVRFFVLHCTVLYKSVYHEYDNKEIIIIIIIIIIITIIIIIIIIITIIIIAIIIMCRVPIVLINT